MERYALISLAAVAKAGRTERPEPPSAVAEEESRQA